MTASPVSYLLLNGAFIMLAGLFTGFPLRCAIVGKKQGSNPWRIAHSVLIMDGLLMLVVGLTIPNLMLHRRVIRVLVWSLVASGYGFTVAFILGALKGLRGLTVKPYGLNTVLLGAHMIGALGSLIGIAILTYGGLAAILYEAP